MQNRDAHLAIRVHVWVVERDKEPESRRLVRVFLREGHLGFEIAAIERALGVHDDEAQANLLPPLRPSRFCAAGEDVVEDLPPRRPRPEPGEARSKVSNFKESGRTHQSLYELCG